MFSLEKKIKILLTKNNISIEKLAFSIGITKNTLLNVFKKNEINTKYLVKISEHFDMPMSYFFDEDCNNVKIENVGNETTGNGNKIGNVSINNENEKLKIENEYLKKQIKDKEEIINLLKNK